MRRLERKAEGVAEGVAGPGGSPAHCPAAEPSPAPAARVMITQHSVRADERFTFIHRKAQRTAVRSRKPSCVSARIHLENKDT